MKTEGLQGAALDWAVAKCEDKQGKGLDWVPPDYSSDWAQGGPIIEREQIIVAPYADVPFGPIAGWGALQWGHTGVSKGATPLVAAMRCYVASKLGDEVEIPIAHNGSGDCN